MTDDIYVMIIRDTGYQLVGPFCSWASANDWGHAHAYGPHDDPRWQTVELADPHAVRVVTPDAAVVS